MTLTFPGRWMVWSFAGPYLLCAIVESTEEFTRLISRHGDRHKTLHARRLS